MALSVLIRSAASEGGEAAPILTFDGGRVAIGRGIGCEVRLPDPSVSQRHASLRVAGAEYTLVDEGSTNGTFAGGIRLAPFTPRVVRSGDLIRVGRVWLEIRVDHRPPTQELAAATRDLALSLVARAMGAAGEDVLTKVHVVEGPDLGTSLSLAEEGRVYVLGRGEECDLLLLDMDASREHVQVVRRGGTVLVRDLGSKNGALLGESRISSERDVAWKSQTMMRIGKTVLALEEPVALALAELEQAQDEALDPDRVPTPPTPASEVDRAPKSGSLEATDLAAPVVPISVEARAPPQARRSHWSVTDVAVVVAAVGVIAISVAGLYWLLTG